MGKQMLFDLTDLQQADQMSFEDAVHHAALFYAKQGIPVVPLDPNSKKLPVEGGINYMSVSAKPKTINGWFGKDGKYRGYNIGIGCGGRDGVMALDIDTKPNGGTTGEKEIATITAKEGPLPAGPRQRTPSGGLHYLYQWQDNAASSSSKVANGIDTRGGTADRCTGHIVVYPSKINGKKYTWEEGGEIPPMPQWLVESLGTAWKEKRATDTPKQDVPVHQINRMLTVIDPDGLSYEDWVKIGMGLKSTCGDDGLEIWDEWSRHGSRRKNNECQSRWKSFKDDGGVGFGTLLFMAKEAGWRPLPGDVSSSNIDAEIEERVLQMNKKYALLRMGKSLLIATFDSNQKGRAVDFLAMQSFRDISAPEKIQIPSRNGFSERPMSELWMGSPLRRQYNDMGIYPLNDQPETTLNTWNGWAYQPDPNTSCALYLDHMLKIVCDGDEKIFEWLLDWMADAVQDTRNLKGCCVVLKGIEGCGKGVWADTFGSLFGKHYSHLIDSERLVGKFNSFLADSVVIFADEVLWPGDRKAGNVLKGLVSESVVYREAKGVDVVEVDNLARVIIASNEDWIIPAGPQSRRWLVLNCSGAAAGNREYFNDLIEERNNGGREALLHYLLNRKITFDLRVAPHTKGLAEQRMLSNPHDSLMHWVHEMTVKGGMEAMDVNAQVGDEPGWPTEVNRFELYSEYRVWCKESRVNSYDTIMMSVFDSKIMRFGFRTLEKTVEVPSLKALKKMLLNAQGIKVSED